MKETLMSVTRGKILPSVACFITGRPLFTASTWGSLFILPRVWKSHAGIADYMQALMESVCGKPLREIQSSSDYYAEIFVMDNQGANVAMTDKTSDYWQGDEAKFQKSFKGGNGDLFIDEVEFDDST